MRAVAHRMLGSVADTGDAVQEAWLRLSRTDSGAVDNLGGWLTTSSAASAWTCCAPAARGPMRSPPRRCPSRWSPTASAPIVGRTPTATRQLASRARRRVRGTLPTPEPDLARQRVVVDAFLAASRAGDFDALLRVVDPDVVFRIDMGALAGTGEPLSTVTGAAEVAETLLARGRPFAPLARPAVVNGAAGALVRKGDRLLAVAGFTVRAGLIVELDLIADPVKLARLRVEG